MGETYKREATWTRSQRARQFLAYRHGDGSTEWLDLCEGPHVPTTAELGAVKLISVAGAYWRGDERNPMLQRIYGTAFSHPEGAGRAHLKLVEEAKARDHRKLGKELELFMFHEYAPGAPFWLPKGMAVFRELERYARELQDARGYQEISTPILVNKRLWSSRVTGSTTRRTCSRSRRRSRSSASSR